jgi:glutamine---fructose-6-phosphate transaminase (isomerizing)
MCGIFAYLNYGPVKSKAFVLRTLVQGLRRLEYRGYDSAGVCVDSGEGGGQMQMFKVKGNINALEETIGFAALRDEALPRQIGVAHTRWATHGEPSTRNAHPHTSDAESNAFVVVHNGIVSNYAALKASLTKAGYAFASDTDTEVIAVFCKFTHDKNPHLSFKDVVTTVTARLEGAYAVIIKSSRFPGELVATKRGGPLIVGIVGSGAHDDVKTANSVPITYVAATTAVEMNLLPCEDAVAVEVAISSVEAQRHAAPPSRTRTASSGALEALLPAPAAAATSATSAAAAAAAVTAVPAGAAVADGTGPMYVISSDVAGIIEHTNRVIYLEDDDVACFSATGSLLLLRGAARRATDTANERTVQTVQLDLEDISKGGYAHFMLKEICEQPDAIFNAMRGRVNFDDCRVLLGGLVDHIGAMRRCRRLIFIACGTSYHSAVAVRQLMEKLTQLPVDVQLASDFLDRQTPLYRDDSCFFISQSGETADTLNALEYSLRCGSMTVGVVNVVGSSIARLTHCGVHVNAGPEIGVASTKAYTCQVVVLILIAIFFGQDRISAQPLIRAIIGELQKLPEKVAAIVAQRDRFAKIAEELSSVRSLLLIGRGYQWATCLEGALKIKEIAYLHCEGVMAGELKHGPLALVDADMAMFVIVPRDFLFSKTLNAVNQIVARKGKPYVFMTEGDEQHLKEFNVRCIALPPTHECLNGILHVVPMQLLSYYIAVNRGCSVDMPRNLAKSVTVE